MNTVTVCIHVYSISFQRLSA